MIQFIESYSPSYSCRTRENAMVDITLAFAFDFNTYGEVYTKNAVKNNGKIYYPIDLKDNFEDRIRKTTFPYHEISALLYKKHQSKLFKDKILINIAGNGLYTLVNYGMTQEKVDEIIFIFLKNLVETIGYKLEINYLNNIVTISGGQSGVDEAGTKAGVKLKLNTIVRCPKGFKFRNEFGIDICSESKFKERFF